MKQVRNLNPNPAVEEIMQAYLKTYLTERQFEDMIVKTLEEAKGGASDAVLQERYDKGFSDGYDSALAENQ